jgi:hypothetical protein
MMPPATTSENWQIETIAAFVVKQKRDRYVERVSSPKRRKQFVADLAHFADFDSCFIVKIPPSSQSPAGIEAILRERGAPDFCSAISEISAMDNTHILLTDALKRTVGYQMGTILCCIPGHLAYFENEDDLILERKA